MSEMSEMSEQKRYIGKVKWFNVGKGFGYITADGIEGDIYVNFRVVPKCKKVGIRRLLEAQEVSFELAAGKEGYKALNVALTEPSVYG